MERLRIWNHYWRLLW